MGLIQLKDSSLDRELKEKGYVIMSLLDSREQREVIDYSDKVHGFLGNDMFFSNLHHEDKAYIDNSVRFLEDFFWEKLQKHIVGAEWMNGVFINKPPGVGEFANHQDWSLVDEDTHRTYCAWIPLTDVSEHNGTFCVLEGSHNFLNGYRSATIHWEYQGVEYQNIINTYRKILNVKLGEAVIFDSALIHATTPNLSKKNRVAALIGLKPSGIQILHHFQTPDDATKVEVFEVDLKFFTTYDYKSRPSGYKSLGVVDKKETLTVPCFKKNVLSYTNS